MPIPVSDLARAAAYLNAQGFTANGRGISAQLLELAFASEPLPLPPDRTPAAALVAAEHDWRAHVGEHDRADGSGLDQIFKRAGWGSVPSGKDDKVPDWCGMFVVSCLIRAGLNARFNTSFLHCLNVEAFFTYGDRKNVNPARLDTEVLLGAEWSKIRAWHSSQRKERTWILVHDLKPPMTFEFKPGDVMLIDWSRKRTEADHITIVREFDGRYLKTFEGNRTGQGPGGERWTESVVTCTYDLTDPQTCVLIYGVGRLSPLDFGTEQVR